MNQESVSRLAKIMAIRGGDQETITLVEELGHNHDTVSFMETDLPMSSPHYRCWHGGIETTKQVKSNYYNNNQN